ncbi:glycosyltransferase family 39 protein [Streptacidiphilus sp. EB129]|uniref:glycosyltransferase family 39 protein n=1 Tax=Streptacidiphilus sp. EB129 TaxID=3156262 RepID=UPI003511C47C
MLILPGERRYWGRLVPVLAVLAAATHAASFARAVWSPDEGYLATQARMLARGGVLYGTVVDRKPPLLPWLYQGAFALSGSTSLWPVRVLAIGAHLATAVLLAAVARGRWGDRAGAAAGVLYLLLSVGLSPEDTQAATFEVFMLPATAAAFWLAQNRRWAAAGAAAAVAALTKQTGGAVLIPVLWLLWRDSRHRADGGGADAAPRTDVRTALPALMLGFGLPVLAVALATGPRGFLFWVVTGSSGYASLDGAWLPMAGRALGNAGILALAALGLLVPLGLSLAHRARTARRRRPPREAAHLHTVHPHAAHPHDVDLWVWLAASALGVATGLHFFGHYYLQLVPPLVLLGVAAVARGAARWRPLLAYTAVAGAVFCGLGFLWPQQALRHAVSVAAEVDRMTAPGQPVLVWGMHPEVYWLADRAPASRYLTAGLLTNFAGGRDPNSVGVDRGVPGAWAVFDHEMAAHPPALVVDDSGTAPYAPRFIAPIRELLAAHYTRVGTDGTAVLYRLRDRPGGQPGRTAPGSPGP